MSAVNHFEVKDVIGTISFNHANIAITSPNNVCDGDILEKYETDNKTYHVQDLNNAYTDRVHLICDGNRYDSITDMNNTNQFSEDDIIGDVYVDASIAIVDVDKYQLIEPADCVRFDDWTGIVHFYIAGDNRTNDYYVMIEGTPKAEGCERFVSTVE